MPRQLGADDRLLTLIGDVAGHETLGAFRQSLLLALGHAVPSDFVAYNEVGEAGAWAFSQPALDPEAAERWLVHADEHPVLAHMRQTRDGRPSRISDHLTAKAFKRTALYREFYGPLGIESQVAFSLPATPPLVIGIALSRGPEDFSDEDVDLLARARPHLIQAYRTAEAFEMRTRIQQALERGLIDGGREALAVTRDGTVRWASPGARAALGVAEDEDHIDAAARARTRTLPGADDDALDVLLVDQPDGGLTVARLEALGLTRRQAEALRWLALGRTAPDAARAMGLQPRTVAKHLQLAYAKLGVTSRSEAAAVAWAAMATPEPRSPA